MIVAAIPPGSEKFKAVAFDWGVATEEFYKKGVDGQYYKQPWSKNQAKLAIEKGNIYSVIPSSEIRQDITYE